MALAQKANHNSRNHPGGGRGNLLEIFFSLVSLFPGGNPFSTKGISLWNTCKQQVENNGAITRE